MTTPTTDLSVPASALVVAAHPDDAEFGAGGTLAKWAARGAAVHHLVLTDGSKGTWDPDADVAALVTARREEQREASRRLGGTSVHFAGRTDGELVADAELRRDVAAVIRRVRPAVVVGHDPWKRYRLHPDHRAAGWACIDGVVAARDPFFHPELLADGLEPHRPDAVLLFEADEVDHVETLDERAVAARIDALEAHTSQMATTHFYRVDDEDPLSVFRQRQRAVVATAGALVGAAAGEAFHLIDEGL